MLGGLCLIVPLRLAIEVQESGATVNGIVKRVNAPSPGLLAIRSITYLRWKSFRLVIIDLAEHWNSAKTSGFNTVKMVYISSRCIPGKPLPRVVAICRSIRSYCLRSLQSYQASASRAPLGGIAYIEAGGLGLPYKRAENLLLRKHTFVRNSGLRSPQIAPVP